MPSATTITRANMSTSHHIKDDHHLLGDHDAPKNKASLPSFARPVGFAPTIIKMISLGQREVRLSETNLKNHTLPVRSISDFFSADVIGGSNIDEIAPRLLTVIYEGRSTQTDIDGSKWILRDRSASRAFFGLTTAKAGDIVVVDKLADYVYAFRLKGDASV